ncbi:GTP-binding protein BRASSINAZOLE INSENSITIVE PALE GREEN 2, chloroplastic [Quercus robur]|uniref:GTP-binding protein BRASSINAZOLE INSENSITIVE PALE GREEN 2, chloroplastic n=1 Tax=Quercus robur TaxID=38942 RepID=UPI00216226AA|nr:GTP-binding protein BRASSINAZOLE INSENSITIVE PALE GREEN 2, chloroplastic [Quercus robur]
MLILIARTLSTSQKLKHSLYSLSQLFTLAQHQQSLPTPKPKTPPPPFLFFNFKSFSSSIPSLPFTRDGNYEEPTSLVCPGCGVHMQNSNPKHPGFFLKPSEKNPDYHSHTHLVHIAQESEFPGSLKRGLVIQPESGDESGFDSGRRPERPVVCARCHSLRHYGKVKDPTVENLLPDFDFDHTVGRRLASTGGTRSVVLMVVDATDFDGSFPRKVARLVSETIEENSGAWKQGKSGNLPRMVMVVTKIDLLPTELSPTRLEHWVRQRAREGGAASKMTSVHMVSAVRDWGLKNLVEDVVKLAGPRGNVWAIGAQNAGKSTLLNSIGKHVGEGGGKITHLTEAPVPGTTLGIIRVEGILPGQGKLFDTPGLLHPHQITTRLTREEQKLVHISKELRPRTYRIKAGHTVHISGLMRLDIEESSVDSIYITVWASPYLPLHLGKTENAQIMQEEHFGLQLQPPIGEKRVEELGKWVRREFRVCGNSWDSSSVDIAASGLGWFAVGLKGEAVLGVWTYEGVDVVLRNSLIPYRSHTFEVAGFTVSKIVSKADQALNKPRQNEKKRKQSDPKVSVPAESPILTVGTDSNSC